MKQRKGHNKETKGDMKQRKWHKNIEKGYETKKTA